jgi:hypothetical protein
MADDKEQKINNTRKIVDQSVLIQNIDTITALASPVVNIDSGPFVNGVSLEEEGSLENSGTTINKLYNFKDFIEAYNQLSPASLSTLIPYIQIWKIYENDKEFFIPFNNFYPKSAIDSITAAGSDRGYQANLVSLEFISQGKDTATTFIYQVKMNIVFDSIQTLFNENSRYLELFNPPKEKKSQRLERDPKYYQIKLKFGWNYNKDLPPDLKPQQLEAFANVSGSELFLNYVIHKLTINEDGSVGLQVEYIGSLEAMARNSTKLTVLSGERMTKLKDKSEEIRIIEEKLKEQDSDLVIEVKSEEDQKVEVKITKGTEGDVSDRYKGDKETLEKLYGEKNSLESNNKKDFTDAIINKIIQQYGGSLPRIVMDSETYARQFRIMESYSSLNELNKLDAIKKSRDLLSINSNNDSKKLYLDWAPLRSKDEINDFNIDEYLKQLDNPDSWYLSFYKSNFKTGYELLAAGLEPFSENASELANITGDMSQVPGFDAFPIGGIALPPEIYSIPFFNFGSLLKALQIDNSTNQKESEFLILCSDCNIANFGNGNFMDSNELAKNPKYKIYVENGLSLNGNYAILDNTIKQINITEIPISIATFRYWVNKNITSQNLTQMNLINFLNLAITDLLNLAVKSTNQDYVPTQNIQFKFFFDKVEFNDDDAFLNLVRQNQGKILSKSLYGDTKDFITNKQINSSNPIKKNIIVFYTAPQHNLRKSDLVKDLKDGIPHFFYGQNRGIINKITFREENMPFVREANIQTQVDRKPWKAGVFLRGKYNVTIEMLGTVNFRIGSMIYISPSFPGVINYGDPIEYGIGGYFVIVSIKTFIESGKYITTLEANWVATGTGEYSNLNHLPFKIIKLRKSLTELKNDKDDAEKTASDTSTLGTTVAL